MDLLYPLVDRHQPQYRPAVSPDRRLALQSDAPNSAVCLTDWARACHTCALCSIRKYAGKDVEWIVRIATAYAWLTSMCIVGLVPLDVWTTLAGITTARDFVGVLWSVAYW